MNCGIYQKSDKFWLTLHIFHISTFEWFIRTITANSSNFGIFSGKLVYTTLHTVQHAYRSRYVHKNSDAEQKIDSFKLYVS